MTAYPVPAYIYDLVLYDTNESLYLDRLTRDNEYECVLAAHSATANLHTSHAPSAVDGE